MLPTKHGNGMAPNPMALPGGNGQAILIELDDTGIGVGKFKHEVGMGDHLAADLPLLLRQAHTGVDGVLQGVGKDDGQLRLADRQLIRQGDMCLHLDILSLGLGEVSGKDRVQHRRAAPVDRLSLLHLALRHTEKGQRFLGLALSYQLRNGAEPVTKVVPLDPDGLLHRLNGLHPALEGGERELCELRLVAGLRLPLYAGKEQDQDAVEPHHQQRKHRLYKCGDRVDSHIPGEHEQNNQPIGQQPDADYGPAPLEFIQCLKDQRAQMLVKQPQHRRGQDQYGEPQNPRPLI